jgi:hypothetical protein
MAILDGLNLNGLALGVDRALDQSSPSHDVDWAYRRARYSAFAEDVGYLAGMQSWAKAGIAAMPYLFLTPRSAYGHTPEQQAAALMASAQGSGQARAVVIDYETDSKPARPGSPAFNHGLAPKAELQAAVDHCDAAGALVVVYSNESQYPTGLKHVAAHIVANYTHRPAVAHDAWQWTGGQPGDWVDRDIWFNGVTFALLFKGAPVKVAVPLPPTPHKERFPMLDLVPQTLHRVVDLPVGTVFRENPSVDAPIQGNVTHADAAPAAGQTPGTMAFGYRGQPIGVPDWLGVANGDRGVWVRAKDVAGIRTADKSVGV